MALSNDPPTNYTETQVERLGIGRLGISLKVLRHHMILKLTRRVVGSAIQLSEIQ
jgi:hypothetical protein